MLDDELDDEPLDALLVLEELLDGELDELLDDVLDELLDGELEELLDGVLDELDDEPVPPVDELPVLLEGEPSGEVGKVVQPVSPAATTATGAPDNSSRNCRRFVSSAASAWRVAVLRGRVGMTVLQ